MVTLRTPKAWPRRTARWFRERVRAQSEPGVSPDAERCQSQAAGAGFVLAALIGLTTLAVAWVGVWWVPAYLTLMVCIFAIPHGRREPEHSSMSNEGSTVGSCADPGEGLRVDRVNEVVSNQLGSESISELTTSESAVETGVSHLDLASSGKAKVRRTRSRTRKAGQTGVGNTPAPAAVTWIRVGPGKFVRAEGGSEAVDQTRGDTESINDQTITSGSGPDLPTTLVIDDALVAESGSPESPAVDSGDQGRTGGADDCVTGSATEVYGIAPSTFDSIRSDSPSVEDLEPGVPEAGVMLDAECPPAPDVSNDLSAHDRRTANAVGSVSGNRLYRFSRRIANTIRSGNRTSLRCAVRRGPKTRCPIRSSSRPAGCLERTLRRAFGRVSHIQRALRPRSPPST
jgi:hypothetical protein